jgi:ring-1,2-phenylacetyl-CoA epoxidase subunit PaaE
MTAPHDFRSLRVVAVRRETPEALGVTLAPPDGAKPAFAYQSGQHLVVRATIDGEEVRRTYSICSAPGQDGLAICIKLIAGGAFSGWAAATLKPGATLDAMPPAGRFMLPASNGTPRRVVAIVAGSGITPVIGILEKVLATEPHSTATLIYGNRSVEGIIFRERLDALKDRHVARLQVLHVLSRDAEADVPLLTGRIDADKIRAFLSGPALPMEGDHVFLCGPDTLIKTARDTLLEMGTPRTAIHFEYFRAGPQMTARRTSATPTPPAAAVSGAEVVAILDGARKTFRVAEGQHVIDAALAAGIRLPYSCRGGMCCTCRARLVEGDVVMDRNFSLEPWEMEAGFVLTCQARPTTARIVVDYDQM